MATSLYCELFWEVLRHSNRNQKGEVVVSLLLSRSCVQCLSNALTYTVQTFNKVNHCFFTQQAFNIRQRILYVCMCIKGHTEFLRRLRRVSLHDAVSTQEGSITYIMVIMKSGLTVYQHVSVFNISFDSLL